MTAPLPLPESFALTLRGYDREQVDERIDELLAEIRLLTADRDAAVAEAENLARRLEAARAGQAALQVRFDRLCRTPADPAAVSGRVRRLLELADAEAAEVVATAWQRAAAIVREAEETAARRDSDARARAAAIVDEARESAERLDADARAQAAALVEDARRRAERLAEAERRTAARLRAVDALLADTETLLEPEPPLRAVA